MSTKPESLVWDEPRLAAPHAQEDKSARVRAMFDAIAPTYERVNAWLSAGRDSAWRRRAVELAEIRGDDRVLDVACGTGDFARAFAAASPAAVVGCDFAPGMLELAARSSSAANGASVRPRWCRADALRLAFADESFTVVSCAFGIRNWQDLHRGLAEAFRVLRRGGRMVILEFSAPSGAIRGFAYRIYFRRIFPRLATWISGDRSGAYRYLPASVYSFLNSDGICDALRAAGFERVRQSRLTSGIATVYVATKS